MILNQQFCQSIDAIVDGLSDEIVELRRQLHRFPELSWQEHQTSKLISDILRKENLIVKEGICHTGLTAEFSHNRQGKTLAVRADMDGLPIQDAKRVVYASNVSGVMHACGHDSHMAIAVGVCKVLKRVNVAFPGTVRFIFQPCEEATPSGAHEMVKSNVMAKVDGVLAFHVAPEIEVGKIGLRTGILTAFCNEFRLAIFGKGGHAARPHQTVDTIYVANQVVASLYDIVGKRSRPFVPAVLSIGSINGGSKSNIIPDRVDIQGTIRTVDSGTRKEILASMNSRVDTITREHNARYELDLPSPIPSVHNDAEMISLVGRSAEGMNGLFSGIIEIREVSMGGEDFSWYLTKAPGALVRLGVRTPGLPIKYLHTDEFDIDERALQIGIALMSRCVLDYLMNNGTPA